MSVYLKSCSLVAILCAAVIAGCAVAPSVPTSGAVVSGKTTDPFRDEDFVLVTGGCYQMGDVFGDGEAPEKPAHEVCVSDFLIGKYEVTQAQWEQVMGSNPASRKVCGPDCPVENLSWDMIQEFTRTLNNNGKAQYRLPTEAEWEYAARSGGKKQKWSGTNEEEDLVEFAWYDRNSEWTTHPVGQKKPNSLGLYDMSGNVLEWCQDYYDEGYYAGSPQQNPAGPANGSKRVLRGGIIGRQALELKTTYRAGDDPSGPDGDYGFRLVRIPGNK